MAKYAETTERCPGRMVNGPGKRFCRCDSCGRVEYEKYEGDRCSRERAQGR